MCVKIIELIGNSSKSFEDAIADGVKRASKTIRGISGVDVLGQTAVVADGKIVEYRVNMKVAFKLE
jgi:flavin-binding protein dodecin